MISSITSAVQRNVAMGQDKKQADLQPNIVDPDDLTQRTDYGVGISDPDNTLAIASKEQQGGYGILQNLE